VGYLLVYLELRNAFLGFSLNSARENLIA